jgi:hypothetical protein
MAQERWDVVLRFTDGPMSYQGDLVVRGPVVRLGASPGPGGLTVEGYRGIDDRQAVITAYDGGTVAIAPVGVNQVRVATHENVDWKEIHPLRKPVYLSPGSVFHLGPPHRGATIEFIEARRLGVWEQKRILSDASQGSAGIQPSNVAQLDAGAGMPKWFIPTVIAVPLLTLVIVGSMRFFDVIEREKGKMGPAVEGEKVYKRVDPRTVKLDTSAFEGVNQAFAAFVMGPNATASGMTELAEDETLWDQKFLEYVKASVYYHARAQRFWNRLDAVEDSYRFVVGEVRKAGLPDVLAAIPYQESAYTSSATSVVCAKGWWQFMPEVAHRVNIRVKNCSIRGKQDKWTPTRVIPVRNVVKNATYVGRSDNGYSCKIRSCDVDERTDLAVSTRGAIEALQEAWEDDTIAESGAAVQITILSHNAGYDNSRFEEKRVNRINILPAYRKHLKAIGKKVDPSFYGRNITCVGEEFEDIVGRANATCGGVIANQSQHYAYSIVAQHILAACYYAENYGAVHDEWREYVPYTYDDNYCRTFEIPQMDKNKR